MKLTETINANLKSAIINKDIEKVKALRQIKSCYTDYADKEKDITDKHVIKICRKLIDSEKMCLVMANLSQDTIASFGKKVDEFINNEIIRREKELVDMSVYIQTLMSYIPKEPDETDIKIWIANNIDFSKYKNKMMAMKDIKNQFPMCDGNKLKNILNNI